MVNDVIEYFENNEMFYTFKNIELKFLKKVFASPQQILGIAVYSDETELRDNWRTAGNEFAVSFQSHLKGILYDLKWDMYLILIVDSNIENIELCKEIENDRMYFKKIVLARNLEGFIKKIPVDLKLDNSDQLDFFSDQQFLTELKKHVSPYTANKLDFKFFEDNSIDDANKKIFLDTYTNEGVLE